MKKLLFKNARLVFPDFTTEGSLLVEEGRIAGLAAATDRVDRATRTIDCAGDWLGPGFVDVHNHGACRVDYAEGEGEELARALRYHQGQGTTSVLATVITQPRGKTEQAIRRVVAAERKKLLPANFAGLHLEGPYLNPEKKGMHVPEWLRDPDPAEYRNWLRLGEGRIRLLTAAPERPGALEMYAWLRAQGVAGAIGHSAASWDQALRAAVAGASHFVHVNNAVEWPVRDRNEQGWMQTHTRGIVSCLSTDLFTAEIIADGYHVTPEIVRLILAGKGPERVALVSDSSPLTGLKPGRYAVSGVEVELRPRKLCSMGDGSSLASSVSTLLDMVRNLVSWGVGLADAWRMASWTPARIGGLGDAGVLRAGNPANLVRLDSSLQLKAVYQQGDAMPVGK